LSFLILQLGEICRWGEASTSGHQTQQQTEIVDWWDENLWDGGYIEDGDDEPGNMTLQDLQSSLLESGDFASAAPRHHEAHSSSQEATTSSQRGSVTDIPSMTLVNFVFCLFSRMYIMDIMLYCRTFY
jgi:hypothetical protein